MEFYAPWCGHCKALAPNYAEAAKRLKEEGSEVKLAKVDATVHGELAQKYGVKGYPTIKFFSGGDSSEYSAGRQADDIVNWLKKKTGPPATTLTSAEQATEFSQSAEAVVIGFFEAADSDAAKAFLGAAAKIENVPAGIVSDRAVAEALDATLESIVMFKKFDDGRATYDGEFDTKAIVAFVKGEQIPLFIEFNDENANRIFGGEITVHMLFFFSVSSEGAEAIREAAVTAAKDYKGKVIFVQIDTDVEDNARITEYFGLSDKDYPTVRLIKLDDDMLKYKPEATEITAENLRAFLTEFFDGKLSPSLSSEEIPEDWDSKPVKVLVGKNFWDVVQNSGKDVFVEFYAPWCGHCKALAPVWDELAEKVADVDVIIAKMDSTANEVEGIKVQGFPTLKYFKSTDPTKGKDYSGGRTLEDLEKFVRSKGEDMGGMDEELDDEYFDSLEDDELEEGEDEEVGGGEEGTEEPAKDEL